MRSTKNNLEILFEDNHLIIVNKKVGDIVQGDKTGDKPLSEIVKEYIKDTYKKPGNVFLGVVHRLDRPTTGIVIFAKTSKALERMNKMLREKHIQKTYWALVEGCPDPSQATLEHYLRKNPKNNKSTAFSKESKDSKKAILHYDSLLNLDNYVLLEINLETGRHHQIRVITGNSLHEFTGAGFSRNNGRISASIRRHAIEVIEPQIGFSMVGAVVLIFGLLWAYFRRWHGVLIPSVAATVTERAGAEGRDTRSVAELPSVPTTGSRTATSGTTT